MVKVFSWGGVFDWWWGGGVIWGSREWVKLGGGGQGDGYWASGNVVP